MQARELEINKTFSFSTGPTDCSWVWAEEMYKDWWGGIIAICFAWT